MKIKPHGGSRTFLVALVVTAPLILLGVAAPQAKAETRHDRSSTRPVVNAASSPAGHVAQSMDECLRSDEPTEASYASGTECPPAGFPYEPVVEITKAGLRAMDPFANGCSRVPDTGAAFDFRDACATHDYLADLQRFGADGVTEPGMDDQFLLDMKADCKDRNVFARKSCEAVAYGYRAGVQEGDYSEGDEIGMDD